GVGGADAGNDLVADADRAQRLGLLFEPAEYAGIAGLEPDHIGTRRGIVDQQAADMFLPRRRPAGTFADGDESRALARMVEDRSRREVGVEHDVGGAQARSGLQRQQIGIAGTRRDKGHEAAHASSAIKWKNVPVTWPRRDPVSATSAPLASRTAASGGSGCAT